MYLTTRIRMEASSTKRLRHDDSTLGLNKVNTMLDRASNWTRIAAQQMQLAIFSGDIQKDPFLTDMFHHESAKIFRQIQTVTR